MTDMASKLGKTPSTATPQRDVAPRWVSFDEFHADAPENEAVLSFWRDLLHNVHDVPSRADCDLLNIVDALPTCVLLHIEGPGEYTVRLFGTGLVEKYGVDLTGANAFHIFEPEDRPGVVDRMKTICNAPAILRTLNCLYTSKGIKITSEWVFLPLKGSDERIDHTLVSITPINNGLSKYDRVMGGSLKGRRLLEVTFAAVPTRI